MKPVSVASAPQTIRLDADHLARAPLLDQQRARNLEQEIADEEDARAEPEHGVREAEVAGHLQGGVADVHAVHVVEDVEEEQKRRQPSVMCRRVRSAIGSSA